MTKEWTVTEEIELLQYLFQMMPKRSRNSVKGILSRGQVLVNGTKQTQFNLLLQENDIVEILTHVIPETTRLKGIKILFEDQDIIVIHKASGILSIATKPGDEPTVHRQLNEYIQSVDRRQNIYIVHRLDRDTSGVMILAKSKKIQEKLQEEWHQTATERSYIALVEGKVEQSGTITSWLTENDNHVVESSPVDNGGKKAITHFDVIQTGNTYSLLKVYLETGRKNQIRVHMNAAGHPVAGDKKYRARTNPMKRLGLHAETIRFIHPRTHKQMTFTQKVPGFFRKTVR